MCQQTEFLLLCYRVMHDISLYWYKCVPPGPVPSKNTTSSEEAREKSDAMPNISDVMLRKLKLHRGLPGWCVSSPIAAADTGFHFLLEKQIEVNHVRPRGIYTNSSFWNFIPVHRRSLKKRLRWVWAQVEVYLLLLHAISLKMKSQWYTKNPTQNQGL